MMSLIFLIAGNLLPLAGVLFWGWDVFVLLILYWLETLVIAFWAIVKMLLPPDSPPPAGTEDGHAARAGRALFTIFHAGIFMVVHFVFLWTLFSGPWRARIAGVRDFWNEIIIGSDLWAPLLILFLIRFWQVFALRIERRLGLVPAEVREPYEGGVPGGLYTRIIVMQLTIIFGGWLALTLGGRMPALVLLVFLKTAVELFFDPMARRSASKPEAGSVKEESRS